MCNIYIYTHTLCKDLTSNARGVGQYYILEGHTFQMVLSSSAKQDLSVWVAGRVMEGLPTLNWF